jgi:hypothetical protein
MLSKLFNRLSNLSSRNQRVIFLSVSAVLVLSIIGYASIPDANGVIQGCYKKSGGTLRVIDTETTQCDPRNETSLTWNQSGPQGPEGPQGPQGPAGAARRLTVSSAQGSLAVMPCADPIRTVTFDKQSDSSRLRIGYTDLAFVYAETAFQTGFFVEVKLDGQPLSPTQLRNGVTGGSVPSILDEDFTIFGYADGVAAGSHTLTTVYSGIGTGNQCRRGPEYTIEIEEIP